MEGEPLEHEGLGAAWKLTRHLSVANGDRDLELSIGRVEMRWIVIAIENRDGDAEES